MGARVKKKETTRDPEVKESKEKKSTDAPVRAFISYTFKRCCSRDEFHSKNEERRNRSNKKTACIVAQFSVCSVKGEETKQRRQIIPYIVFCLLDYILFLNYM